MKIFRGFDPVRSFSVFFFQNHGVVVYLVLTTLRNVGGPVSGKLANWLLPVQWKRQPGLWKRASQLLRRQRSRMSSRNFTFLPGIPFSSFDLAVRSSSISLGAVEEILSFSLDPCLIAPRDTSKRLQGRRTRGKSKSKETTVLCLTRASYSVRRAREKRKCAL